MREARLILAEYEQDGTVIGSDVEPALTKKLVDAFGGYTASWATGAYKMNDGSIKKEIVVSFDIAMEDHLWPALTQIAIWLCGAANQECVYARSPDGEVHFFNADTRGAK